MKQKLHDVEKQQRYVLSGCSADWQKVSQMTAVTQEEIQEGHIVLPKAATRGATGTKRGRKKGRI